MERRPPLSTREKALRLEPSKAVAMAHGAGIARHGLVGGDQQQPFSLGLGQQQAIKGIAVQGWQAPHRQHMLRRDRDLQEAPPSSRVRRRQEGRTWKPSRPSDALITSSHREATLKQRVC